MKQIRLCYIPPSLGEHIMFMVFAHSHSHLHDCRFEINHLNTEIAIREELNYFAESTDASYRRAGVQHNETVENNLNVFSLCEKFFSPVARFTSLCDQVTCDSVRFSVVSASGGRRIS